ncbi:MAG: RNA polymerase sigma factor FliA [Betaproteobacteria bacterium]|nr:RNA polymerase sigma factor FliA [Betaproteobacteria bacterium]
MYDAAGRLEREQLVERFLPLVKRLAHHLMARLPPNIQVDDLIQNGMIGLLDAIGRFESGMGAQFETYATQRIRGAMLDGLRETDWVPRGLRQNMRRIEACISRMEQENGRQPSETELAAALEMPLAEYQKLLSEARGHQVFYFEDLVGSGDDAFLERHAGDESADPVKQLENIELMRQLVTGIEQLPEREKLMMALYYEQDLNLREIGEVMGVSESRVCQLHSQAVARLRARIFGIEEVKKGKRGGKNSNG